MIAATKFLFPRSREVRYSELERVNLKLVGVSFYTCNALCFSIRNYAPRAHMLRRATSGSCMVERGRGDWGLSISGMKSDPDFPFGPNIDLDNSRWSAPMLILKL